MDARLSELLEEKKYADAKELLSDIEAADIALILNEMSEHDMTIIFRLLVKETAAEVFVELDSDQQEMLISGFSDSELKDVIDEMYLDDAVDIVEEMPANVVSRILRHADPEVRNSINELLKYPKDSAGSIMTIEYVDLKGHMTINDAFTRIRRTGLDKETIYTCYVTDSNRVLQGLVSVKDLLLADSNAIISDIMQTNIIYANTLDDQEAVAHSFEKYDLLAIPVVDNERRLVGIVTVDDALDVIQLENTEDIEKMAAITPTDKPYLKTSVFSLFLHRIPWLLLLMISATFTGAIITAYESALGKYLILSTFIPMLMDTGGNSGGQSSVTIIRGLSLGEIRFQDMPKILWKEFRISLLCGITLAAASFIKLILIDRTNVVIASVVCGTLLLSVVIAKLVGCTLPMLAKKLGFDPAVMASPFVTTIVDALSLIVYFNLASYILGL